jgi:hypothetical protein
LKTDEFLHSRNVRVAAEYLERCGEKSSIIEKKKRRLRLVGHWWVSCVAAQ